MLFIDQPSFDFPPSETEILMKKKLRKRVLGKRKKNPLPLVRDIIIKS